MAPLRSHASIPIRILLCISLFAIAWLAVSCSGSAQPAITLAVNNGVEGHALKEAAREYQVRHGVKVTIAELPYANLFEKELLDLANNTGAYDVVMLDDPWFPRFTSGESLLTDLEPLFAKQGMTGPDSDFVTTSIALCRQPYETGRLYALPYVGNSQLFFYREDLFNKHQLAPPDRWEHVLNAARIISENEKIHGYVLRAEQGNAIVADFLPLFWAFGAEMFDGNWNPTVNSREGIEALEFMLALGKYAPPGYVSFNADEVAAHVLQGTAAQTINWPAWIKALNDPSSSRVIGKVKITTMPGHRRAGQAEIGNWLLAIPKGSHNVDVAFSFLLWATGVDEMRKSALAGNPPTRLSLFDDPVLRARYPAYPVQLKSLSTSRPRPRTPLWNEIENAFGIFLSKANSGELTAEEAMNQANAELARIIERGRQDQTK